MEPSSDPTPVGGLTSPTQEKTKDTTDQIEKTVRFDTAKEGAEKDEGSNNILPEELDFESRKGSKRPTYTRMSIRYLDPEVLDKYKINYAIDDRNSEYVIIKRWVPEYEQDFLWAASKELREKAELARSRGARLDPQPFHLPAAEPAVIEVSGAERGADLDLKINRIPFEKWLEFKGSDKRGKHVLDVAIEHRSVTALNRTSENSEVIDSLTKEIDSSSVPVRLAINSEQLAHELSKITNMRIRPGHNVIIPPWKPLVAHYDAILLRFQTLKGLQTERNAAAKSVEETPPRNGNEDESSKETPSFQHQEESKPKPSHDAVLKPCEVCELLYPPHDTPLQCLDVRISHLQCLIDFLDNDLKHVFELRRDLAAGKIREIAFEDLWHLFNPGDLIFSPKQRQAYRVFHTSGGRPLLSRTMNFEKRQVISNFRMDCFYIDFDRIRLGPVYEMVSIGEYSGKRQITSLNAEFYRDRDINNVPVFPVRFLDNLETVIESLIQRGRRLLKFGPVSHKRYHGPAVIESIPDFEYVVVDDRRGRDRRRRRFDSKLSNYFTSDIIIDSAREGKSLGMDFLDLQVDWRETAEGCPHYGPTRYVHPEETLICSDCGCSDIVPDEAIDKSRATQYKEDLYLLNLHDPSDEITDEHFILLPALINAFVLQQRAWFNLSVDFIQDLDGENETSLEILKKKSGLEDLILPEGYCDLLEALIKTQPSTRILREKGYRVKAQFTDLTRGKGQGPIILFHGESGLGKTSTAEYIANYTQRPLYPIPCSGISLDAENIERYLEKHLDRAQEWNCIVLIDDIDSFTASSTVQNSDQRASTSIVSTFCHILDNYRGPLILTTKDASSVSQAVLSRIHVSLHFPPFDQDATIRVWQKNVDRVRADGLVNLGNEAEKEVLAFAKAEYAKGRRWDGRQIRNSFQIAESLAEYDAIKQLPATEGAEAKGTVLDRPSLTSKMLETAVVLTGKLFRSAES